MAITWAFVSTGSFFVDYCLDLCYLKVWKKIMKTKPKKNR